MLEGMKDAQTPSLVINMGKKDDDTVKEAGVYLICHFTINFLFQKIKFAAN